MSYHVGMHLRGCRTAFLNLCSWFLRVVVKDNTLQAITQRSPALAIDTDKDRGSCADASEEVGHPGSVWTLLKPAPPFKLEACQADKFKLDYQRCGQFVQKTESKAVQPNWNVLQPSICTMAALPTAGWIKSWELMQAILHTPRKSFALHNMATTSNPRCEEVKLNTQTDLFLHRKFICHEQWISNFGSSRMFPRIKSFSGNLLVSTFSN